MKEFVEYIAKHLVDNPENVNVEENSNGEKGIQLILKVQKEDIGKIIGRKGRTVQAMRTLLTAIAAKEGMKSGLDVVEK
jgi:predicted RNA-binding protein YlqC (UPF0109 family)